MNTSVRYLGKIRTTHRDFAFIDIASVVRLGDSSHDIPTKMDIYLHKSEIEKLPKKGSEVEFSIVPDTKRAEENAFRAVGAQEFDSHSVTRYVNKGLTIDVQSHGPNRELMHPTPFVTWCVSPGLAAKIREETLRGSIVRLLLVSFPVHSYTSSQERRVLVELGQGMTTVPFVEPGHNRLGAFVVFSTDPKEGHMKDAYLERHGSYYNWGIVSHEADRILLDHECYLGADMLDVEIPRELFAERPADWEWVNRYFTKKPADQCNYRWRRVFAYTIQPPMIVGIVVGKVALWATTLLVVFGALLMGMWRVTQWDALENFPEVPGNWLFDGRRGSWFVPRIGGKRVLLPLAVSPFMLLLSASLTQAAIWTSGGQIHQGAFLQGFAVLEGLLIAAFAVATCVDLAIQFARGYRKPKPAQDKVIARRIAEVDAMICETTVPKQSNVWQLPPRLRNVRFYAAAVKQAVCRGFAVS